MHLKGLCLDLFQKNLSIVRFLHHLDTFLVSNVPPEYYSHFYGIGCPRTSVSNKYHWSRVNSISAALAQARMRLAFVVPITG